VTGELDVLQQAERLLAEATTVEELLNLKGDAEVARAWAKRARLGTQSINHATGIKVRAEIKLADIVDAGQEAGTIATRGGDRSIPRTEGNGALLPELGVDDRRLAEARLLRDHFDEADIVGRIRDAGTEREINRITLLAEARAAKHPEMGGDEWYTPRWLFDALGVVFDLDACAPVDRTHASVPARQWYTIDDDGLAQDWRGFVWCNPPYSDPTPWAERMIDHGDGLLLSHVPINGLWCLRAWNDCAALRLLQGVEFVRPNGELQRPGYWLQLAAFGERARDALINLDADEAVRDRFRPSLAFIPVAGT
jgi:hypothetical protein